MSQLGENLKKMIDIFEVYRLYSQYYRKMAVVFLLLEVLSYIVFFFRGGHQKVMALVALAALFLMPFVLYYGIRMVIDVYRAAKPDFNRSNPNKMLWFYDAIYIFVLFIDPLLTKLIGKF